MEVLNLGLIDYAEALKIQEASVQELILAIAEKTNNAKIEKLIICEHPTVITVGRALNSRIEVFSHDIPIYEISRGGRATLHLPGQIVCYPILDLSARGRDLHKYMRSLEESIVETLSDFRIEAQAIEGKTGVWVGAGSRKIASLGIAVKKWVSYHGIALNIDCDLNKFQALKPCGFSSDVMTSVKNEMSEHYKQEWVQVIGRLKKDVILRLIENLREHLEVQHAELNHV